MTLTDRQRLIKEIWKQGGISSASAFLIVDAIEPLIDAHKRMAWRAGRDTAAAVAGSLHEGDPFYAIRALEPPEDL